MPMLFAHSALADDPSSLERVLVEAKREPPENGYRVEAVDSLGPLGSTPLLNAPYTIGVLPLKVIENSQAVNFKDVSKYLPLVQYQEQQGPDILRPQTRGMQGGNFQNSRMDGMTMFVTVANAMEQFQQIEVLNGVSASLYGPANPSGMFNFVSKRPTDYDLRRVSVTYDSDSIATAHIDMGGPLDKNGVFGFRFNALFGEGDGYVDHSHQRRALGSVAFDIHPSPDTVLELNYSDYDLVNKGYPGWFTYGETVILPAAPIRLASVMVSVTPVWTWRRTPAARASSTISARTGILSPAVCARTPPATSTRRSITCARAPATTPHRSPTGSHRAQITSNTAYLNGTFATWGSLARPDSRHGWLQVRFLFGYHPGERRERSARFGQHRQSARIPISCRWPAEHASGL